MSGKAMKRLRKFTQKMNMSREQYQISKKEYRYTPRTERSKLNPSMDRFNAE